MSASTRRWIPWLLAALAAPLLLASMLACALWLRLTPPPGHWSVALPVGVGPWQRAVPVSMPKLLDALTDPTLARWADGHALPTHAGTLRFQWHGESATMSARCTPCSLRLDALADEPVVVASAVLSLRRAGEGRYEGELRSGDVTLRWNARVAAMRADVRADLAPTPIAALVALLGNAVPEARVAQIDGTLVARMTLRLPEQRWSVEPRIDGFAVSGLGTESLLNAEPPPQCLAPARGRRVSPLLEHAVIAAEDRRFHEHAGYDLVELRDAIAKSQRSGTRSRGASTITQQLARIAYTGAERTLARKVREVLYAVEMERTLGKGRILRMYLALAPWGEGLCGAEAAARYYVGTSAASLDGAAAADLALRLRGSEGP